MKTSVTRSSFLDKVVYWVLSVLFMVSIAVAVLPEVVLGDEVPWGYEYVPVVITWYEGIPKKTQELKSFKAKGAFADTTQAKRDCEDKAESVKEAWGTGSPKFTGIVLCIERPLTKPIKKEPEKK